MSTVPPIPVPPIPWGTLQWPIVPPIPWGTSKPWDQAPAKVIRSLSATTLEAFLGCKRKFVYTKILGEDSKSPGMVLGTRVHEILESYLLTGAYPDLSETFETPNKYEPTKIDVYYPGQIAESGLYLLPRPGTVTVEAAFKLETPGGSWTGRKDGEYQSPEGLIVLDHKTTSGKRTPSEPYGIYGKAPEPRLVKIGNREELKTGLSTDVQAILYCYEAAQRTGEKHVTARWIFYLTSGPKRDAWESKYRFSASELSDKLGVIDEKAAECTTFLKSNPTPETTEPNTSECDNYGGCPFHVKRGGPCVLSIGQLVERGKSEMGTPVEEMIAKLKAKQAGATPPPITPAAPALAAPPPIPTPVSPVAAPVVALPQPGSVTPVWDPTQPMNPAQEYLRSKGKPWSIVATAADTPPPAEVGALYDTAFGHYGQPLLPGTNPGVINPPEAPPLAPPAPAFMPAVVAPVAAAPQATEEVEAPDSINDGYTGLSREDLKATAVALGLVEQSSRMRRPALLEILRANAPNPLTGPGPQVAPQTTTQVAPSRTTEVGGYTVPVSPPRPINPPPPIPAAPPPLPAATAPAATTGFTLYVNCRPVKGVETVVELADILNEVMPRVVEALGTTDYRLADYGKGPPVLAGAVDAFLREMGWTSEVAIVIDLATAEGRDCLMVLSDKAGSIVRGY